MNVLALLATLAVVVSSVLLIVKAVAERSRRPSPGPGIALHDLYEVAFLNGGPARVVDTALTALHADGRLAVGGPGIVAVQRAQANDPVERAVFQELAAAPNGALHVLREAVMRHPAVQEVGDGLAARGLLVPPHRLRPLRQWGLTQGIACMIALPLSLLLTFVQFATDDSLDFSVPFIMKMLPAIVIGSFTGMIVANSSAGRLTASGRHATQSFRAAYAYVVTPAHLVATLGLRALPDPVFQAQLMAAARLSAPRRRSSARVAESTATGVTAVGAATVWCAASGPGGSSCGGSSGGGSGSSCGGGSGCSSGSGCGGGSGSGSGSSCGGGSSCGSSSGSSCGGGGGGSSCGGGGS
ncbi:MULTISPECIES: TIGR04222 domain-containing membrane protein [unclassified Streptomyces]|uniref:TIGR04222 domain-containing membrane protein n=1 Tax=unclassified Streptomyces TaxID=2593676 RepID=UPI001B35BE72|nr:MULTISPECIES: TIGR04222 domain-containing membrane protein [unclassified Streptomyces]MBQ1104636.1 TIGR04222 domain-containing membrane protein [Streptomyces sp. 404i]MBQ1112135.1 TIGR04222 domain-containing membrane protein [Streptomyces sp. C3-3]